MQIRIIKILSFILLIILFSPEVLFSRERKHVRISWENIKGIDKYRVEIKDENNKIIINKETEANYLEFNLPVGKYKLRIGSLNKFNKINTWSEWESIEVQMASKKERRISSRYKPKIYDLKLIKLGLGYSYYILFPKWDKNFENSYINAKLNLGLYFGGFSKLKKFWFFRYSGIEFEFDYVRFFSNGSNSVEADQDAFIFGFNFYMRTNFKFPMNLIFRFGGGVAYSIQDYNKYNGSGNGDDTSKSMDFFMKPEIGVEFRATKILYVEVGTGFFTIFYKDEIMYTLKPSVMIGFTF